MQGGRRGNDFQGPRPRGDDGVALPKTGRRLDPGGRDQTGGSAEKRGVSDPAGTQRAGNQARPVGTQQRRKDDSCHTEVGIVRIWPKCNHPIPQQSPPPESAVEVQNVIGHHATAVAQE